MRQIVFGFFDVLVNGHKQREMKPLYLKELAAFCKSNNISMYVVTGVKKEIAEPIVKKNNLLDYFCPENIIYIDDSYLSSLSPEDKELKEKKFNENNLAEDDYHKIHFLKTNKLDTNDTLFVGHDIWTDAFYLRRYTKANVILIKDTISNNHNPFIDDIKELQIITPDFELLKKYLVEPIVFNYSYLDSYATKALQRNLIGAIDFAKLDISSIIKKKQEQEALKKLNENKKID